MALLESLAGAEAVDEVVELFAADVRAALRRSAKRQAEFDEAMREPETDVEKLTRAAKFAVDYGLPLARAAGLGPDDGSTRAGHRLTPHRICSPEAPSPRARRASVVCGLGPEPKCRASPEHPTPLGASVRLRLARVGRS